MKNNIQRHMNVLELDKILNMLAEETNLKDTAEMAVNIKPSNEIDTVKHLLQQTSDAHMLVSRFGSPSFGYAVNVSVSLARAKSGGMLNMRELLDIGELLRVVRSLKDWRERSGSEINTSLDSIFDLLTANKYFEEKIFFCIKSEDEMNDNASAVLADIRRRKRAASANIRERLEKMIRSSTFTKYLQDALVTQRDGRFVIPVKSEYRGQVPGLVHDTSASGATLFIEPMAIVEINNDLKVLELKEKDEIERILTELSAEAAEFADSINQSYDAVVQLDLIFAKANLAFKLRAITPEINTEGKIRLKNARHPLIDSKKVVPITVSLGIDYDTLIITGPNTGGKTVTLKTIGLLTLMAMCGLMIPADHNSTIAVFDEVLADIGDEQSIEQSLSTFSSHMKNIINILSNASCFSLVLLDELGAGTDPVEGAALAMAILKKLREKGAKVAATTHYAELKTYALQTEGVENACCEFDVATLSPTYRLLIGIPGRSNAFAISERLGLANEVIETAKGMISDENLKFENVVAALEEARQSAEEELQRVQALRKELDESRKSAEIKLDELNRQREKMLESARQEAKRIVDSTKAESNRLLTQLEELKKKSSSANIAEMVSKARAQAKSGVNRLENLADPVDNQKHTQPYKLPRPLVAGDTVLITDLDKKATVIEPADNSGQVLVLAGIIKTRIKQERLKLLENKPVSTPKRNVTTVSRSQRSAALEVDLRGQTAEEAIMTLDRFIDDAVMGGTGSFTIIHGKGSGVLRKAVHQYLRRHKSVKTFRLGVFGEGEDGVTIAELK